MDKRIEEILPRVQKPARYTGGEYGSTMKDKSQVDVRFAFCFPDTYEIGMSNLGMRILYGVLNNMPGTWCERVFAPWPDMEAEMRSAGVPLYALESGDPIKDFDFIGFTVQYELCYTNILTMLDMAGLELKACDRSEKDPIIICGGPCTYNIEPIADIFDIVLLGEGEEMLPELMDLYVRMGGAKRSKKEFLRAAAELEGFYVPSFYNISYREDGNIAAITPKDGVKAVITKRIIEDLDTVYYPEELIVPSTEIVHDRAVLELFRGCIRGCRFCQAGHTYRPIRQKLPDRLIKQGIRQVSYTGCEELGLSSLSTSDYKYLAELTDGLIEYCDSKKVSLSVPSLRADNFSMSLMERIQRVRKSGLTFAPEAGTQRLRDVINKNLTEEEIIHACETAFAGGYGSVKLYYMLGLPTETNDDIDGIAEMADHVVNAWRRKASNKNRGLKVTVSTSLFIPKPFTPFQWERQCSPEEMYEKIAFLRSRMTAKAVTYNYHDPRTSTLEGVFARGDRR
ncbi:MAG: TIGR03960 family B12-binding radical SAM protein, partial [Clostridia bacterium]|nr:TIGR03960 family B12-binding radical SAM protein [Clostridia bacterium]